MYVCMYVCMYVYVYVCKYRSMYVYVHVCMCYVNDTLYVCMLYMYVSMHVCVYMYIYIYTTTVYIMCFINAVCTACMYVYMYVCMYWHRMCDHPLVLGSGAVGDGFQHREVSVRRLGDLHRLA